MLHIKHVMFSIKYVLWYTLRFEVRMNSALHFRSIFNNFTHSECTLTYSCSIVRLPIFFLLPKGTSNWKIFDNTSGKCSQTATQTTTKRLQWFSGQFSNRGTWAKQIKQMPETTSWRFKIWNKIKCTIFIFYVAIVTFINLLKMAVLKERVNKTDDLLELLYGSSHQELFLKKGVLHLCSKSVKNTQEMVY